MYYNEEPLDAFSYARADATAVCVFGPCLFRLPRNHCLALRRHDVSSPSASPGFSPSRPTAGCLLTYLPHALFLLAVAIAAGPQEPRQGQERKNSSRTGQASGPNRRGATRTRTAITAVVGRRSTRSGQQGARLRPAARGSSWETETPR